VDGSAGAHSNEGAAARKWSKNVKNVVSSIATRPARGPRSRALSGELGWLFVFLPDATSAGKRSCSRRRPLRTRTDEERLAGARQKQREEPFARPPAECREVVERCSRRNEERVEFLAREIGHSAAALARGEHEIRRWKLGRARARASTMRMGAGRVLWGILRSDGDYRNKRSSGS